MAGRGPAPKDPEKRARMNKDTVPHTILKFVSGEQPFLPADFEWHEATIAWWQMWGRSEIAKTFTEADWFFLLDTARVHTAMWNGFISAAAELRQRVAKFGATPEDRARLRIFFAGADKSDEERGAVRPAGFGGITFTGTGDSPTGAGTVSPIRPTTL